MSLGNELETIMRLTMRRGRRTGSFGVVLHHFMYVVRKRRALAGRQEITRMRLTAPYKRSRKRTTHDHQMGYRKLPLDKKRCTCPSSKLVLAVAY